MAYNVAIKNLEKKEFDWENNNNTLDFHLRVNGVDNYFYSGAFCMDFEYYTDNEFYKEEYPQPYSVEEFKKQSQKLIKKFLNRKNKKKYPIDRVFETMDIELFNYSKDDWETVELTLQLTYCA